MNASTSNAAAPTERLAYRIEDFSRAAGIGRTKLYEMIKRGEIRSVIVGGRRLIPSAEAARLFGYPEIARP